ncbi:MAG: carboxypeptidase-like regulatory domain-containing protein [Actinomycetota bacterium]
MHVENQLEKRGGSTPRRQEAIMRVAWLGALLVAAALSVPAARAQVGNSSISGMITYSDGTPANGRVFVGFQGKYRQIGSRFRGGKNTGYTITGLLPGRYELIVTAPGAKPRRIWGATVGSFEEKLVNVELMRCTTEEERFYTETGMALLADTPQAWEGGWLQGILLTEGGAPVEGTVNFYRGTVLNRTIPVGAPGMPAYFEIRNLPPGAWDILFVPSRTSKLKRVKLTNVIVDPSSRTFLEPVAIPAGTLEEAPAMLALPERSSRPVPATIPRKKLGQ